MDDRIGKQQIIEWIKKYRCVFLVLLAGIFLMTFPTSSTKRSLKEQPVQPTAYIEDQKTLEEKLSVSLSRVAGAGEVEVLLTFLSGEKTVFQSDTRSGTDSNNSDTVLIMDASRNQTGLVSRVDPPQYLGAVVICEGAEKPEVRLSITEAVAIATGLSYNHITVLKMK